MRRRDLKNDYQWVLEYRVPAMRSELHSPMRDDDDDDDDDDEEALELDEGLHGAEDVEQDTILDQLRARGPGGGDSAEERPLGVEIVRAVSDEVVAMEMLLPGERSFPFPGVDVSVTVDEQGRACFKGGDDGLTVMLVGGGEQDEEIEDCVLDDLSVRQPRSIILQMGERLLLVRPVGAVQSKEGSRWWLWVLFVLLALTITLGSVLALAAGLSMTE